MELIPVVVNKNDADGNFCNQKEATVYINHEPVARTLTLKCGNGLDVHHNNLVVAMRGRNPDNPKSRKKGIPLEQRLEPNEENMCNTLTTVQKDNLLLEEKTVNKIIKIGTTDEKREKTFTGVNCVYSDKGISPTLLAGMTHGNTIPQVLKEENTETLYRIRRLTPKECWRLMGYTDEDFDKAKASGVSNSQLYKQAGNAIVKQVLMAIFKQMLE